MAHPLGLFRDSFNDITLAVEACAPGEAAAALRSDLDEVKSVLRAGNMQLNDAKEQVYGAYSAYREAWEASSVSAVEVAGGLGVFHRGRRTHPALAATLGADRPVTTRIGTLRGARQCRGAMALVVLCGKPFYGCETQWVTHRQMRALRSLTATSMGRTKESQAAAPFLLHFREG